MRLIAIANISNGKNTVGLRLLDVGTGQIKDVPIESIKNALESKKVHLENIRLEKDKLVGTNGQINRLPKIVCGKLVGKSPLIIIDQLGKQGYTVSDYKGTILKLKNEDVIKYAKENGIANGKMIQAEDKEFISSIKGEYQEEDPTKALNAKLAILSQPYRVNKDGSATLLKKDMEELKLIGIKSIHSDEFYGCNNLKRLYVGGEMQVSPDLMQKDIKLNYLEMGEGVLCVPRMAYDKKYSLTEVIFPNSLEEIGYNAFAWCDIKKIKLGDKLKAIDSEAFEYCTKLEELEIGKCDKILNKAFYCCSSLKK